MIDLLRTRPIRTLDASLERDSDGAVVRPRSSAPVAMNPTALALWELCDGKTTVEEMVTAVCVLFDLDPVTARADVESAVEDMLAAGVVR